MKINETAEKLAEERGKQKAQKEFRERAAKPAIQHLQACQSACVKAEPEFKKLEALIEMLKSKKSEHISSLLPIADEIEQVLQRLEPIRKEIDFHIHEAELAFGRKNSNSK